MKTQKPLNRRSYGSIPHLPNSRMGPADHHCEPQQGNIAIKKTRNRHDRVIVQEKLDGSNVGVAKVKNTIVALTRAGYLAHTSPFKMHHMFSDWVRRNAGRFDRLLAEGERVCGEWIAQAHGTRYQLSHEPFVAFDIMSGDDRTPYHRFIERIQDIELTSPFMVHMGEALSIEEALTKLGQHGRHGAQDSIEGIIYRVETNKLTSPGVNGDRSWQVNFLTKYVRPDKIDGSYLFNEVGENGPPVWNHGLSQYLTHEEKEKYQVT